MSIAGFFAALDALRVSLHAPDVIRHDDVITIELPYEAGFRFEQWVAVNATASLRCTPGWMKTCSHKDAPNSPWREVDLGFAKVKWPLKLIALPSGHIVPEPDRYVPGT